MPLVHDGGGRPQPVVTFHSVVPDPVVGGGATMVEVTSGTVEQAVAAASQAVKPILTAPSIANLPTNAKPGEMYGFPSQPEFQYVMGFDYVWRAIPLVTVE